MSAFKTFIKLWKEDRGTISSAVVGKLTRAGLLNWMSDKAYLKLRYRTIFHKKLDLKNPKTFNEKLQWLKLYDRKKEYVRLVDKHLVKEYISQELGAEYVIPTLYTWDDAEKINPDVLPDQFVLKCNHDSGSVLVCRNKADFDWEQAKTMLNKKLKDGLFWFGREWPYKHVKPCILAEAYMSDETQSAGLTDYKFYCFDGVPKFLYVSKGLENHSTATISFLNMDWTLAPYRRMDFMPLPETPDKPKNFEKMVQFAEQLSKGIPFLRVDMYEIEGKLYFSELTFFPSSGFTPFVPEEWDETLGSWITLPEKTLNG